MYFLLALLLLVVTVGTHAAAVIFARRAVGGLFRGEKRERSAGFAVARAFASVAAWYLASSSLITLGMMGQGEFLVDETSMRVHVASGGPASRAGVLEGDRIVKVAGEPITSWDQLRTVVGRSDGEPVAVEIARGSEVLTLTVIPEGVPPKMLVGPWSEHRSVGVGRAFGIGLVRPAQVVAVTFKGLRRIVTGSEKPELSGPVGIVKETSNATKASVSSGLLLAAALASYVLPLVAFASALYEILARRRAPPAPGG